MDDSWNTSGIYMLTCKINGKRYIGQSKNIKKRLRAHKSNKHKYHNQIIKNAIAKYGWENFEATVLEFCPIDKLDEREIYYIAELKPEYNIKAGGSGGTPSIQTRELLSKASKDRWQNTDIRKIFQKQIICKETGEIFDSVKSAAEKFGISRAGISHSLNNKQTTAGGCHWEYLNEEDKFSEERRYNLGCANRGRKQSPDQIAKRVAHIKGKKSKNYNSYKPIVCVETGEIFQSVKIAGLTVGVHPIVIGNLQTQKIRLNIFIKIPIKNPLCALKLKKFSLRLKKPQKV